MKLKNSGRARELSKASVATLFALLASISSAAERVPSFYHLESATVLKGAAPDWDYLALDPTRPYLYIGRRGDGVSVFDAVIRKVVKTLDNSKRAGAIRLVPEFHLAYTANETASPTQLQLPTLHT